MFNRQAWVVAYGTTLFFLTFCKEANMHIVFSKIWNYSFKMCFCPLRCANGAQGEPKVLPGFVYGSGENTKMPLHSNTNLRSHKTVRMTAVSSRRTHTVWVCIISCRWSWGRICFVRAFCPVSSALIKNTASLPPAPSSAPWTRTTR